MFRSLSSALVPTCLVIGALVAAGTRPATSETARLSSPPDEPGPATSEPTVESTASTTTPSTSTTTPGTTTPGTTTPGTTTVAAPTTAPSTSTTTPPTTAPSPATPASSVTASHTVVGVGGEIEFTGTCEVGAAGPVFARVTGTTTEVIATGLTGAAWTYTWTAPADPALISSFTFEFWCGDPIDTDLAYPAELRRQVDMVASVATPTTTVDPAGVTLPATG